MDQPFSDQASAYVLGQLTGDELAAFEARMASDVALAGEVRELRLACLALSASAPRVAPPPGLRDELMTAFQARTRGKKPQAPPMVSGPPRPRRWLAVCAFGSAAAAVAAGLLAVHFARKAGDLSHQLAALKTSDDLKSARIAVMGSLLKSQPNAVGVSVWQQTEQHGVLVVENFPALPPEQDYQLWVIDEKDPTPVSAGTFRVDAQGRVRIEFQPVQPVGRAQKFAVTVEPSGGSTTPTLKSMVIVGQ